MPGAAVIASAVVLLLGVGLNYVVPDKVFTWVTSIATIGAIWTWGIILLSQIRFRRGLSDQQVSDLKYKLPFFPYTSYLALAFLAGVVVVMGFSSDTRIALIVGPIWFILLVIIYYSKGFHKR